MTDLIERPTEPGGFIGDIFYGHPIKSTMGTHRWDGAEWAPLPSEAEALMDLLAKERDTLTTQAAEIARLTAEREQILSDGAISSDQRERYDRLRANIMAGKASQQDASSAIEALCRDNERLAVLSGDRKARAQAAERAAADAYARGLRDAANAKGWEQFIQDSAPSFLSDWQRGLVAGQQAMRSAILALIPKPATEGL